MTLSARYPVFLIIFLLVFGGTTVANNGQQKKPQQNHKLQRGVARSISKSSSGKPTSSGERHNHNDLVAAHKTLPIGTYVYVQNHTNGKTAILRINDRLPSENSHLLLVSWGAAKMLNMLDTGRAFVDIQPIVNQVGIASWYGKKFHGRKTANGEIYNMNHMTAAHKTLPFNTRIRVVNLDNNRSVIVRINDRGPFVRGRIIDLSRQAATQLGMIIAGTTKVRLEILPPKRDPGK